MNEILLGDCLEKMYDIWDDSVDLIICDPPYGKTGLDWDNVIDPADMWWHFRRIIKDSGTILIFGREPFLSRIRMGGEDIYKYDWVWRKSRKNGQVLSSTGPLQDTENIAVFSKSFRNPTSKTKMVFNHQPNGGMLPTTILDFKNVPLSQQFHPCQKPIELADYLIKTHSDIGNVVLDPCCGSGTFMLSAKDLNRNFIGIESNEGYVHISETRIKHGRRLYTSARTKPVGPHKK